MAPKHNSLLYSLSLVTIAALGINCSVRTRRPSYVRPVVQIPINVPGQAPNNQPGQAPPYNQPGQAPYNQPGQAPPYNQPGQAPAVGPGAGNASCVRYEDHCLPEEELRFVASSQWRNNYTWIDVATQQTAADGAGEAKFFLRKNGSELVSKWFYKTRRADPGALAVGQMVIMFHDNRKDSIYLPPETTKDAIGRRWWMARIVSLAPLRSGNHVIVSGGHKVHSAALRLIEGDPSSTLLVTGNEDSHFLTDSHWMTSKKPLTDQGYQWIDLASAITPPSAATRHEGNFLHLGSGIEGWSANAWRTRIATPADIVLGARVFMFHDERKQQVYGPPTTRLKSLTSRWWSGLITDNSTAYKGTVTVAGKYTVAMNNLRVAVPAQ